MATLERIYTIPLSDAYGHVRTKRAKRAVKLVREFALRHMKAKEAKISEGVNSRIFRDGMQKPPRRIKVRIVKGEDQIAKVWLVGEEEKLREAAKKEEEKKQAAEKKAEEKKKEKREEPSAKPSAEPQAAKNPAASQAAEKKP
ncbi:MAG: 60S ribosomal protein L31 [Candidatus Micrarchaeota archaeon]|nr:60S ribosomal protein L31 [Candidatus Micrarchaeota archaeon]